MQAIETTLAVRAVPLSALVRSPMNVRKKADAPVGELAASIAAHGLLQNLVGFEQTRRGKPTGKIAVVAGGRRLEALEMLALSEELSPDHPVPCKVVSEAEAIDVSLAENFGREALHPADQIAAFSELAERGKSVDAIAAAFGVRPLDVKRYLKLANVSPRFIEMFRADEIEIEQLQALALTDDHGLQERIWNITPSYNRDAHGLRQLLTANEIDAKRDVLARFVGIEAYEAAGGSVRRDLFSDEAEGYIQDPVLLRRLASVKLEAVADSVEAEGLPWAEARLHVDYDQWQTYGRARMIRRQPTDEEQAAIVALTGQLDALQVQMEASDDEDETEALEAQYEAIDTELDAVKAKLDIPDPEDVAVAGAVVTLNANGAIEVRRGLIRPEDRKSRTQRGDAEGADGKAKPLHSERLTKQLTAHRTAAMQAVLAARPLTALVVLTHRLALDVFGVGYSGKGSAARISVETVNLRADADDLVTSRAWGEMNSRRDGWTEIMPLEDAGELFSWLLAQPQDVVMDLMAFCIAASLNTVQATDAVMPAVAPLTQALNLDMAEFWAPTAASYLNHVPKARILNVVAEALPDEPTTPLAALKKAQLVELVEAKLHGSRWVPALLRS